MELVDECMAISKEGHVQASSEEAIRCDMKERISQRWMEGEM